MKATIKRKLFVAPNNTKSKVVVNITETDQRSTANMIATLATKTLERTRKNQTYFDSQ